MAENLGSATLKLSTEDVGFQKGLDKAEKSTSKTFGAIRGLVIGAGAAAAGAVAAIGTSALNVSSETDKATKKIRSQLRTTEKESKRLGKAAVSVFKNNFADSIEEAGDAVVLLSQQLGDAARGQEQTLVEAAFGLRDAWGPEVDDVIAQVATLTEEFDNLDPTQAMDLVVTGFQRGLDKSGDFLDSIGEYSNLFSDAGFSAAEFFSIMETGQAGGILGTDKIADAFKELQIRLVEGSDDVADALDAVGLNSEEIFQGLSDGSLEVKDVWEQLLPAINAIEDPLERSRALVELMGTQAEDLGLDFTEALDSSKTSLEDMRGASESLNDQYNNLRDNLSGVWRTLITELAPLTDSIINMANMVLPRINTWLSSNLPGIVAAVQDIKSLRITDLLDLPVVQVFITKLKFRWALIRRDFLAWMTTASQRITDFFEAPLTDPIVQQLQAAWRMVRAAVQEWIAGFQITDYIEIPDSQVWAGILKATWQSAKSSFDSWVASANMMIRDYLGVPDSSTWVSDIKAAWSTAKTTFDGWITTAGMAIKEYVGLPDSTAWVGALQTVWTLARSQFVSWLTSAQMEVRDYVGMPESSSWSDALKVVWTSARSLFEGWLESARARLVDYVGLPEAATWSDALRAIWQSAKSAFEGWVASANQFISGYIKIPTVTDMVQWLKDLWGGESGVKATFESWMTTAGQLISEFWQLPAVQDFVQSLKDLWGGPEGAKAVFESWLSERENRPLISFGYKPPDPESPESKGFIEQLRDTMLSIVNAVFEDLRIGEALLAPFIAIFRTDPEAGFEGIINKITESLASVESAVNAADAAIDAFFESFNPDTIGAKLQQWGAALSAEVGAILNGLALSVGVWAFQFITEFLATGPRIAGGIPLAFINIPTNIGSIFTAAGLKIVDWYVNVQHLLFGTDGSETLAQMFTRWWRESVVGSITDVFNTAGIVVASWWIQLQHLLFGTDGSPTLAGMILTHWKDSVVGAVTDVWSAARDAVVRIFNEMIRLVNAPLKAWNDISFNVGGFGHTFTNPFTGAEVGRIGWPGINIGTPDVGLIPSIPALAMGGIVTSPTLAMIGEGGPEAVIPLSAGVGGAGGDLHIHIGEAYGIDNLVDQINEAWLDGRLRGLQDQLVGVG